MSPNGPKMSTVNNPIICKAQMEMEKDRDSTALRQARGLPTQDKKGTEISQLTKLTVEMV